MQDGEEGGVGGATKNPPTTFSPVIFTKAGISPLNFLTFSFNSFVKWQSHAYFQSQITELEPRALLKKSGFSGIF